MRVQLSLDHLHYCYLKALLHKPPLASSTEQRESQRHAGAMQPGKEQWDTLSRSEREVFSIVKPFKRSQLSVLVTFSTVLSATRNEKFLHNISATNINISLQTEKRQRRRSQPLHDSIQYFHLLRPPRNSK